ncbi:MAG TPA: PepSY domain-containing protein [Nitrospiria bacterium]|jgi:uncharacterized iron-regulated membrane protein|nr:PepSY domain-containing protein [Nitrospiria bacterium]
MEQSESHKPWPDHRAVWRWHFYAGLFCIPFVIFLAITGTIYLFKPQIDAWLDRPYDHLVITGSPAAAEARVKAALAAMPGSRLQAYELPQAPNAATRVIVNRKDDQIRVYIHPETLQVLHTVREEDRFTRKIFYLHGELLLGNPGSTIVELAASWAIIMILTGLYLWWPRQSRGLAGVLYPRSHGGRRLFWRDLHAVTGVWISSLALFMLLTGLPWAKQWGSYLKEIRRLTGTAVAQQDWPSGHPDGQARQTAADVEAGTASENAEHAAHQTTSAKNKDTVMDSPDYAAIDTMVATIVPLHLASPVLISPPANGSRNWTAKSDAQNRPLRVNLVLDGTTGAILKRVNFSDHHPIDRLVGIGVAAHEGQLFGWPNQLLGILTASGLILLSVSSVNMWWRRRPAGVLGAPDPVQNTRFSIGLGILILLFAVYLPLFGISMIVVKLVEKLILGRIPAVRDWLGLNMAVARSR